MTESACIGIEGDGTKAAFHLLVFRRNVALFRGTEKECLTVCRESREDFQSIRIQKRRNDQLVRFGVEHHDVAERMIDLDVPVFADEETLMDGIGGIGTISSVGMPGCIAAGCLGAVGLGVVPCLYTVLLHQGSSSFATYLKGESFRMGTVGSVAIEASSRHGRFLQQRSFLEAMQVALVDTDVSTHFITRLDAAIGQAIIIQRIFADVYLEVLVS